MLLTQRWVRPLTKRLPSTLLYALISRWVHFVWPVARVLGKLPMNRPIIRNLLLISQYQGRLPLTEELHKEWAILGTFDVLSPKFDNPQRIKTVREWFERTGLEEIEVRYGYNGIEGRGKKPL